MDIETIKGAFQRAQGRKAQVEEDLEKGKKTLDGLRGRLDLLEKAQSFLQKVAQDTQSQLKLSIEDIVNLALDTCFPNEYEFRLDFNVARGKTEAELVFLSRLTGRQIDPMDASGGGVVDVTAFALRIASYALERGIDNVIILDEPVRFVSRDLVNRAGEILRVLSERMGLQIILVTHIPELVDVSDKVFRVKKDAEGFSKVCEL